jgi:formiminoglutamase
MFNKNYMTMNKTNWQGRVDSEDNFHAFRWHQWVKELDLRRSDLKPFTGKLGFAFIGFLSDEGINRNKGRTGAAKGPESIRRELSKLPCYFSEEVLLFDAGDILCQNDNLEENQQLLSSAVARVLDLNLFPIVLGGGHEVAFGHYNGILKHLTLLENNPNIGIFNFDAHFDLRPYQGGGSSGTMFRQIADICAEKKLNYSYFCAGIQRFSNTIELFKTAEKLGVEYILAKDMAKTDDWSIIERMENFIAKNDHIYITICTDVFSSAFAPGVSAAQPVGVDPELVLKMLKLLLKSNKVVSFDIAEVSPRFDQDNITASLAKVIIFSVITTICENNKKMIQMPYSD